LIANILAYGTIGSVISAVGADFVYGTVLAVAFSVLSAAIVFRGWPTAGRWKEVRVPKGADRIDPPEQRPPHQPEDSTTRRRTLAICTAASVPAAATAAVVATVTASPVAGAAVFAVLSMLTATIVFRRWPVAGFPWHPWRTLAARNADDDIDPAFPGLWRVINIGWVVGTGIVVFIAIRDIAGS